MTVDQAHPEGLLERQETLGWDAWWDYVRLFSRVLAEKAEGDAYLLSKVPLQPYYETIWNKFERPASVAN